MCLASFALMQSIRNTQHLGKANLLRVKRQQKRDLCATGLIKSLESVCFNSLRVTRARNHTRQNPNYFHTPQTLRMSLIIIQKKTINASERRLLFPTSINKVRIISSEIWMNALLSWKLESFSCSLHQRSVPLSVPEQRLAGSDKDTFPLVWLKSSLFLSVYLFFQNYKASSDSIDLALIPTTGFNCHFIK